MNKPDGSYFGSWEAFCAHPQPWGLGRPWEELRPKLEPFVGKAAIQLVTVAPDRRRENGANQHSGSREDSGNECRNPKAARTEGLLRSVLRSPEPVQDLYRAGLIGQVEAAKLGPRDPEPAQAARIVEVARAPGSGVVEVEQPCHRERVRGQPLSGE